MRLVTCQFRDVLSFLEANDAHSAFFSLPGVLDLLHIDFFAVNFGWGWDSVHVRRQYNMILESPAIPLLSLAFYTFLLYLCDHEADDEYEGKGYQTKTVKPYKTHCLYPPLLN